MFTQSQPVRLSQGDGQRRQNQCLLVCRGQLFEPDKNQCMLVCRGQLFEPDKNQCMLVCRGQLFEPDRISACWCVVVSCSSLTESVHAGVSWSAVRA